MPYVSNVTGTWITPEQATSPAYYVEHLRRAVQFEAGVRTLAADPALHFARGRPGHGADLAGAHRTSATTAAAARRVDAARRASPQRRRGHARGGWPVVARRRAARLAGVHAERRRRVPLPTYPFERKRHSVDRAVAGGDRALQRPDRRGPGQQRAQRPISEWFWTRHVAARRRLPRARAGVPWPVRAGWSSTTRPRVSGLGRRLARARASTFCR